MTLYRFAGTITGFALIGLAVFWSSSLESGTIMLFCGSILILLGSTKQEIVNEEAHEWQNESQK